MIKTIQPPSRVLTLEQRSADLEKQRKLQDKTTHALSSRIFTLELRDLPHKIDETVLEAVKEVPPAPQSSAWKTSDTREAPSSSSKQKFAPHYEQPVEDVPIPDDMNISNLEDTDTAHLPKIKTRPDWLKPVP
ncbi:hypothetical protein Tco_0010110 [Tanacetum coccineum]